MKSSVVLFFSVFLLIATGCQKEPDACFEANFPSTVVGKTIKFNNCTSDGESYRWDFGDGETSESESPTHAYEAKGSYTVTMRAFSPNGNKSSETTRTILIGEKYVTEVEVVSVDFVNDFGGPWDPDMSGPDIAFFFGPDSIPPNVFASDTVMDVQALDLPLTWDFSNQNIQMPDTFWFWQLHDINDFGSTSLMGSWKFAPKPKTDNPIEITNTLNPNYMIHVNWEIRP